MLFSTDVETRIERLIVATCISNGGGGGGGGGQDLIKGGEGHPCPPPPLNEALYQISKYSLY